MTTEDPAPPPAARLAHVRVHGHRRAGLPRAAGHRLCGDGGFTMLGLGDLLSQVQRLARVVNVIFNNSMLNFDNIEQQEARLRPVRD
jgi:hypothetical protein